MMILSIWEDETQEDHTKFEVLHHIIILTNQEMMITEERTQKKRKLTCSSFHLEGLVGSCQIGTLAAPPWASSVLLHIIRSWPDFSLKCFLYQVPMCICLSVCLSVSNKSFHARKIYYASWQNSQCRRKGTNSSWLLPENKRHHWGCWLGDLPRRRLLTTTERVVCTSAIVGSSSSSYSSSNETHDGKRLMRWVREEAKETVLSS